MVEFVLPFEFFLVRELEEAGFSVEERRYPPHEAILEIGYPPRIPEWEKYLRDKYGFKPGNSYPLLAARSLSSAGFEMVYSILGELEQYRELAGLPEKKITGAINAELADDRYLCEAVVIEGNSSGWLSLPGPATWKSADSEGLLSFEGDEIFLSAFSDIGSRDEVYLDELAERVACFMKSIS
jgi:hypothetical protein